MNNDDFQNVKLDRTKVVQDGTAVQTRYKIIFSKNKMIRVIADRYFSWQITIQTSIFTQMRNNKQHTFQINFQTY